MNCIDVIFFQAELAPEKLAIVAHGTVISYARLALGIVSAQQRLAAAGLKEGATVGLHVAHPIDNFVLACALYRMKIASAAIMAAPDAYLDNVAFDAVLADSINPAISAKQPAAKIFLVDTAWFQDKVTFNVGQRSHATRDADVKWICRIACFPDDARLAPAVKTSAASLEAQLVGYALSAPPDWERMISIAPFSSQLAFVLGLSALTQGRTICFADVSTARSLIVAFHHHYLVGSVTDFAALLAQQNAAYIALTALRGAYVEGTAFPPSLVAQCLLAISPNTVLGYAHPQVGMVAFGAAGQLKNIGGAVGFVAPWADIAIRNADRGPVEAGMDGELNIRLRDTLSAGTRVGGAVDDGWINTGQIARRMKDNVLVVQGAPSRI